LPLAEAKPVDLAMLQRVLAPEQQAIVFYHAGNELLAFVVSQTTLHTVRTLCTTDELLAAVDEWHFQLGRAEISADYRQRHAERFAQTLLAALRRLYDLTLAPLAPLLEAERLLLIPHGVLHQVPLHALWVGDRFLLELYECSYAPSASLAVQLLNNAESPAAWQKWAGLGLDDPAIPGARIEVETAASHFSESRMYLGEAANLAALHTAAQEADILHLATHGLFRPDNPFCSVLKLADGWVDVKMLYRLNLAARLVVLSACESGAVVVRGGDETIGLARGFLAAGARALLVSLWNVHDASAPKLMAAWYKALTAPAPRAAAALRTAQLESIRAGRHPYEWAPYLVIGG
jgi:CHAT domain-containing protein